MKARLSVLSSALALLAIASFLHSHVAAKEMYADIWQSVGDAEFIVVGRVKESREDGTVILAVDTWLKGTPAESGEISLQGQTGFCVVGGPVTRFMKQGERFLVFVFAAGKPGRLGHIQKINPDGTLPGGRPAMMYCGQNPPGTGDELARLVRHILSDRFVREQVVLLRNPDGSVAREAVRRLGAARAAGAFKAIFAIARDRQTDRSLRQYAIIALGRLRDPRALTSLVEILSKEPSGWASHAAEALGELGDRRAVLALADALRRATNVQGRNPFYDPLSSTCVRALGRIGDFNEEVRKLITRAAQLPGEYPASAAIDLAWQQKLRWMVPALVVAMDSSTRSVSGNAGYALVAIAGMPTLPASPDAVRLTSDEVLVLASEALAEKGVSARALSPHMRDVNGIGWLVIYPRETGRYYVYVGDGEKRAEVLLPEQ